LLHWKPRLIAVAVVLVLLLFAFSGAFFNEFGFDYNLYW
jgi:hypothetical protein